MSNTPKEIEDIIEATDKAKTKYHKSQKEREKDLIAIYLNDNHNTIILTKKENDPELIKLKYENRPKY